MVVKKRPISESFFREAGHDASKVGHELHQKWIKEHLASDQRALSYSWSPKNMRDVGRKYGLCVCSKCGWKGKFSQLIPFPTGKQRAAANRRPHGYCPMPLCRARPFWMPLTEAQAMVLA